MRDIKFRLYNKHDKKMYIYDPKWGNFGQGGGWVGGVLLGDYKREGRTFAPSNQWQLEPEGCEWMEYIGLFDKNDNEICEGDIIGIVTILRDITKEKEIDKMKTEFISTVSHELRTPLTTIREAVSQVLDGILGKTTKEQKDFLSVCLGDIDRLRRIINNLLDISKIEAGKVEIKRGMVDIVVLSKEVIANFTPRAREKNLEIKEVLPQETIEVYVDRDKVIQVFTNLIGNALKFTKEGHIEISIADKEEIVECSVSDTGLGISKEDLLRVFSKFQQFGRVDGPGEKGTGLGLSIAKGIVEMHKGKIWVESELDKGSKFTFTLPKYTAKELFEEYVTNGLREAVREGTPLSILVFDIKNFDAVQKKIGKDKVLSIVRDLETLIKDNLRRQADVPIKSTRSILILLPATEKQDALMVAGRIQQIFDDYMARKNLAGKIEVACNVAGFPVDGKTSEELLEKIRA